MEFCAAANGLDSVVAVADLARIIGGGVGRDPPGEARRFGRMDASKDWEVWWILEEVEIVDIVETLECVGDRRSCPWFSRNVGVGEAVTGSRSELRGLGATGGKRKSGVAKLRSRGVEGAATLLCDRFRFITGSFLVACSGEEEDKTISRRLSAAAATPDGAGISISGMPRVDLTSR